MSQSVCRVVVVALLAVTLHLPFVVRYDLHFQPDFAISVLMSRSILEGERPVFFWGQTYLGTYGCYLTALLFWVFDVSVPIAGLVSLAIWTAGVVGATLIAERLLGGRAAWWSGIAAAVASPYANHYITQPYSSYETAPLLAISAIAITGCTVHLLASRFTWQTAAAWVGLGLLLGFGLWTTRLFVPALATGLLAVVLRARWGRATLRRAAGAIALAVPAILIGASPEILYHLGSRANVGLAATSPSPFRLAPLDQVPTNVLQGLRSLPAYFNGDARARLPEGISFALAIWDGEEPYAGEASVPGLLLPTLDVGVCITLFAILGATLATAVRAWRRREIPLLTLCAIPFVHLAAIGLSAQTGTSFYGARRYWFGSLLVFPMLFGNAMALAEAHPMKVVRVGIRLGGSLLLLYSLVAQMHMLRFPDELGDYRALVRQLDERGEHAVIMPDAAWIVAGLSAGVIDVVDFDCVRRPQMCERVFARDRVAVVLRTHDEFPEGFTHAGALYRSQGRPAQRVGNLHWRVYERIRASSSADPSFSATEITVLDT